MRASKNQPTFGDGESWRPLWSQNVKTNAAVAVDIWVVDSCGKCNLKTDEEKRNVRWGWWKRGAGERNNRKPNHDTMCLTIILFAYAASLCVCVHRCLPYLWRFEGVVCGEVYGQEENPALVRTVILKQGERNPFILSVSARMRNECIQNRLENTTAAVDLLWLN